MSIRVRLTLWYASLSLVSLMVLGAGLLYELVIEREANRMRGNPPDSVTQEICDILTFYTLPVLVITIAGGWWLTRRALAPVETLMDTAEKITLETLGQRLPPTGKGDELDRLTAILNQMLARLEDSVARVRDFTLHASHELKTPLTIMQGEMENALDDESCTPALREFLGCQLDEIQRLAKIVGELTLLAKADAGQVALNLELVRLDEVVRESFTDAQLLAQARQISVALTACDDVLLRGDRHRLRQLLLNLTDNAIKYNQPLGRIEIALRRNRGMAELRISNTGKGISAAALPRVFDRFYRGDPSHNGAVEGCGLGLSIAQWIVAAHGGAIDIQSTPGELTTVTVRLPFSPISPAIPLVATSRKLEHA